MKKVISFCLYGDNKKYLIGMIKNLKLAKIHYPDWEVRIYYNNTITDGYLKKYCELGAVCILCENIGSKHNWEGMFWRWFPIDDPTVDFWISRDADSRLSERESMLVDYWVTSGKTLHTIRDHRCHYHNIMGGMFGINNKSFHSKYSLPKIKDVIADLYKYYKERTYNVDQIFLNEKLWNTIKGDDIVAHVANGGLLVHDTDIVIPNASPNNFIGRQYNVLNYDSDDDDLGDGDLGHNFNQRSIGSSGPLTVLYGIEGRYVDVTHKLNYFGPDNTIIIPKDDVFRCNFFGVTDPAPNKLKHVKIIDSVGELIIKHDTQYSLNSKSYNNLSISENRQYSSLNDIPEFKLMQLHRTLKLKYGSWNSELPEQLLSARFIKPKFTVLELGGNIGRNSLIISSLLDSDKQLLTVEPNKEICALLIENRDANNLSFHIESRALSKRKLWSKGWNTHLSPVEGSVEVDIIGFDDLQSTYGLTFDTLVIDCEGAFYHILNEDENIMKNINLVIIENDFSSILHKKYVDQIFIKNGLKCIHTQGGGFGPCRNNFYEVWSK